MTILGVLKSTLMAIINPAPIILPESTLSDKDMIKVDLLILCVIVGFVVDFLDYRESKKMKESKSQDEVGEKSSSATKNEKNDNEDKPSEQPLTTKDEPSKEVPILNANSKADSSVEAVPAVTVSNTDDSLMKTENKPLTENKSTMPTPTPTPTPTPCNSAIPKIDPPSDVTAKPQSAKPEAPPPNQSDNSPIPPPHTISSPASSSSKSPKSSSKRRVSPNASTDTAIRKSPRKSKAQNSPTPTPTSTSNKNKEDNKSKRELILTNRASRSNQRSKRSKK